jgi:Electron transfer DM13
VLAITEELGRFEEFFSEVIYPAWPVWLVVGIVVVAGLGYLAYRMGWHEVAWRHRLVTGPIAVVLTVGVIFAGYYTISPLFERNTVCEASPIAGAGAGSEDCEGVAAAATGEPTGTSAPTSAPTVGATATPQMTAAPTAAPAPAAVFEPQVVAQGEFSGADDFHFGRGQALLIESEPGKYVLRFENFSVRNGPDLFVYLSPNPGGYDESGINLGGLKGTDGAFNYDVPEGTDVSQFKSAVIWCEDFSVLFATAPFGS